MLCILCVTASDQTIKIFDEDGMHLDACNIISKYFWLKPSAEDSNAKIICRTCWSVLDSFHRFFQMVEKAHTKLSTAHILNGDNASDSDNECTYPDLTTEYNIKTEPTDDAKADLETNDVKRCSEIKFDNESGIIPQRICSKRNSRSGSTTPVKVKIKAEDNVESKERTAFAEEKQSTSESESEIPLAMLNKQVLPKDKRLKKNSSIQRNVDGDSKRKGKNNGKRKVPCQKFDEFIRENMDLSCTVCQKPLPSFSVLKEHYQSVHNEIGYVICCEKKIDSRHGLVHHILLHKDPEFFKCDKCDRVLANNRSLKRHMKTHINEERNHRCEKCKKSFSRKEKLDRHMETHVRRERICEQCGKVTRCLRQHQLREHSGILKQRVQCPKCGVDLADSSSLHRHMKYQHPKTEAIHLCNICGKISSSGYGLERHILYMHKFERRHKCPMCEKGFKLAQSLRVYTEMMYTNRICLICSKKSLALAVREQT